MSEAPDWTSAYLAASSLLGEPVEVATASVAEAMTPAATALAAGLRSSSRDVRIQAVARIAMALALEIEQSELR
jgi:hypothetical protein